MPSERGVLLRRAVITAVLAGGMGAGAATVAIAATHGSAPSTSASTTAATPSTSPSSSADDEADAQLPEHGQPGAREPGYAAGSGDARPAEWVAEPSLLRRHGRLPTPMRAGRAGVPPGWPAALGIGARTHMLHRGMQCGDPCELGRA